MKFGYAEDFIWKNGVEIIEKYVCKRARHEVKCRFTFDQLSYKIIMSIIDTELVPIINSFLIDLTDVTNETDLISQMTTYINRLYPEEVEEVEEFELESMPPVLTPLICPQCGGAIDDKTLECKFCKTKFMKGVVYERIHSKRSV